MYNDEENVYQYIDICILYKNIFLYSVVKYQNKKNELINLVFISNKKLGKNICNN